MKTYNICGYTMYKEEDVKALFGEIFNKTFRGCTMTEYEDSYYIPKIDVDRYFNPEKLANTWD